MKMIQHSKLKSILYHLYPGVLITLFFVITTPYFVTMGFPPQLSMLIAIVVIIAPYLEELYFRGYLLPRMQTWGKYAPLMSAILFSLYHFWQPQIYLTLVIALFPMTYLVWKTKSLKLAIYTHCGLNIAGALLSFGMINQ